MSRFTKIALLALTVLLLILSNNVIYKTYFTSEEAKLGNGRIGIKVRYYQLLPHIWLKGGEEIEGVIIEGYVNVLCEDTCTVTYAYGGFYEVFFTTIVTLGTLDTTFTMLSADLDDLVREGTWISPIGSNLYLLKAYLIGTVEFENMVSDTAEATYTDTLTSSEGYSFGVTPTMEVSFQAMVNSETGRGFVFTVITILLVLVCIWLVSRD